MINSPAYPSFMTSNVHKGPHATRVMVTAKSQLTTSIGKYPQWTTKQDPKTSGSGFESLAAHQTPQVTDLGGFASGRCPLTCQSRHGEAVGTMQGLQACFGSYGRTPRDVQSGHDQGVSGQPRRRTWRCGSAAGTRRRSSPRPGPSRSRRPASCRSTVPRPRRLPRRPRWWRGPT
jgi:hypothetical protein